MRKKGEISVFLVLLLTVISGFIITLSTYVKDRLSRCEAVYAMDNAVRSCFAEYNRKVFDRYHILFIDSSYKGYENGRERVLGHFAAYLDGSISADEICDTGISECRSVSEDNADYMYRQAVCYARDRLGIDPWLSYEESDRNRFITYLLDVFGDHYRTCDEAVREGELEYLIYGYDIDEDNITQALSEYEENADISYDEFLCMRLCGEDENMLRQRFSKLVEEYMRENGSPGSDLSKCYYSMTFTATLEGRLGEYDITRTYGYGSEEI